MGSPLVSRGQRAFILSGLHSGFRSDGRGMLDLRPFILETGILPTTAGSSRVQIEGGATDVVVGVKAEVLVAAPTTIQFHVDCSATAHPDFRGRGGADVASEVQEFFHRLYRPTDDPHCPSSCWWSVHVDVQVLQTAGGNLIDVTSLAIRAALCTAMLPKVTLLSGDGGQPGGIQVDELVMTEIPVPSWTSLAPVAITMYQVDSGDQHPRGLHLVDATAQEEACTSGAVSIAVDPLGMICGIRSSGVLRDENLVDILPGCLRLAKHVHDAAEELIAKSLPSPSFR